jgi:TRAP-type mannitol/chloroaromatic compound transport system permease large subunit
LNIDIVPLSLIILVGMFVLLAAGLPMAFVTGTMAVAVSLVLWGPGSLEIVLNRVTGVMKGYVFIAGPMFILMANALEKSGVVNDLFRAVRVWFGPVGGGLAITSIIVGTIMAAMSGIIGAAVVSLSLLALPVMLRYGYSKQIACGSIMAGGGLGTLMVLPGLMLSAFYSGYVLLRCLINPSLGPPAPPAERQITFVQKLSLGRGLILPGLIIIMVLGSIYAGLATPTEAGAVGSIGAFLSAIVHRKLNLKMVKESLFNTVEATCMMTWLAFGSLALVSVYGLAGGTDFIKQLMLSLPVGPLAIIIVMQLIILVLGMIIDWLGILFLTIPLFIPIVEALGFDPVWFGVLFVMNIQMAYLTPPFGQGMFYVKGVAPPEVSMLDIIKSVPPFVALQFVGLMIVVFIPQIALFLPGQMIAR